PASAASPRQRATASTTTPYAAARRPMGRPRSKSRNTYGLPPAPAGSATHRTRSPSPSSNPSATYSGGALTVHPSPPTSAPAAPVVARRPRARVEARRHEARRLVDGPDDRRAKDRAALGGDGHAVRDVGRGGPQRDQTGERREESGHEERREDEAHAPRRRRR